MACLAVISFHVQDNIVFADMQRYSRVTNGVREGLPTALVGVFGEGVEDAERRACQLIFFAHLKLQSLLNRHAQQGFSKLKTHSFFQAQHGHGIHVFHFLQGKIFSVCGGGRRFVKNGTLRIFWKRHSQYLHFFQCLQLVFLVVLKRELLFELLLAKHHIIARHRNRHRTSPPYFHGGKSRVPKENCLAVGFIDFEVFHVKFVLPFLKIFSEPREIGGSH